MRNLQILRAAFPCEDLGVKGLMDGSDSVLRMAYDSHGYQVSGRQRQQQQALPVLFTVMQ